MAAKKTTTNAVAREAKAATPPKAIKATQAAKGGKAPALAKAAKSPVVPKAKAEKRTEVVQEKKAPPRKRAEAPKGQPVAPTVIEIERLVFDRDRMVAEAAYYRAERRGFSPGADLEDWLEAEAEIERLLGR
jgi:hypothetical protein